MKERGLQVAESFVLPSEKGIKVMLTNCSGITQRAEAGMEVRTAVPAELVDPGVEVEGTETRCGEAPPAVRQAQVAPREKVEWRKQQLQDLLAKILPCQRTTGLC